MFEIHPQLRQDCVDLGCFTLCRVLLMDESRYPWLILVPQRVGISEIYQLCAADQALLMQESSCVARALAQAFAADKLNIAAIGNLVPQLHLHHVVRYRDDAAWPAPVWGKFAPLRYDPAGLAAVIARLRDAMPDGFVWGLA